MTRDGQHRDWCMIGYVWEGLATILVAVVSHIRSLPMYLGNECYRLRSGSNAHVLSILVTYTNVYQISMRMRARPVLAVRLRVPQMYTR